MKKIIQSVSIFLCILCIGFLPKVEAANGTFSVRLSKSSTLIGSQFTATVTISSNAPLGSWDGTISYDGSKVQLVSSTASGQRMVGYGDGTKKSISYTFTFKALASGTTNIAIGSARIIDYESVQEIGTTRGSASIRIMSQQEIESSYSKNNYLASLGIEGKELIPSFNKDTLEYTVEMDPGTTKINLTGNVEDKTASLEGTGEKEVSEGANRFEVKVTAQNGNVRTYVIIVNVKEYNPIEIKVGKETLKVVRKKTDLKAPTNYTETTVTINEEEVPAFKSEITGYTLIGLKDESGTIALYRIDGNEYILYQEFNFNQIIFYPMEGKNIKKNYKKAIIIYQDKEIVGYQLHDKSHYALLYGMNVTTGKEGLYLYNSDENTLQLYYTEEVEQLEKENDKYFKIGIGLSVISIALLITIITMILRGKKKKIKTIKPKESKEKHKEKKSKKEESLEIE